MSDTLVVVPYFNFYPKPRRLAILEDILRNLSEICNVWIVSCGEPLNLPSDVHVIQTLLGSYNTVKCFQKEALINHAISRLQASQTPTGVSDDYERVLFMDADIWPVTGATWEDFLANCSQFGRSQLGQPCSHFKTTQGLLESTTRRLATSKKPPTLDYSLIQGTAPGGCWVVGRDVLSDYIQYPFCFVGGGDSVFAASFLDDLDSEAFFATRLHSEFRYAIRSYIQATKAKRIGDLATPIKPFALESVDHGTSKNYSKRHDLYNFSGIMASVKQLNGELVKYVDMSSDTSVLLQSFISGYMSDL